MNNLLLTDVTPALLQHTIISPMGNFNTHDILFCYKYKHAHTVNLLKKSESHIIIYVMTICTVHSLLLELFK